MPKYLFTVKYIIMYKPLCDGTAYLDNCGAVFVKHSDHTILTLYDTVWYTVAT